MTTYKNAPLRYVVFALDVSPAAVLGERATLDEIHKALREDLPIREDSTSNVGPAAFAGLVGTPGARFVDGNQHRAVTVAPNRVAVDTTEYSDFDEFYALIARVIDAVAEAAPGRACRRMGLRYVDEIRVPGAVHGNVHQWADWVDQSLLAASAARPMAGQRQISGAIDDVLEDGFGIRFAWHTGTGYAVAPVGPLIVPHPVEEGVPYFAFDTDSYCNINGVLGLGDPLLLERVAGLHAPIKDLFESSITDKLRNEVLLPQEGA